MTGSRPAAILPSLTMTEMLPPDWTIEFPLDVQDRGEADDGPPEFAQVIDDRAAQAVEQRWKDFMELMAHEIRNPLAAIIGYTQLMQRRGAYDEQALSTIVAQAGQLNRLVGDLLDSTRLEAGRLRLRPERMDLAELARAATEQAQLTSPRHDIRLKVPGEPLEGWWDRGRLVQMMANLLGNAIKYAPDGGEVLVVVEDLGAVARVSVEDHGSGIAPADLSRIFDPFYRVPATADRVTGQGIGLHVTRALVEAHGGQLTVESLLGRGSVFSFTLARHRSRPEATTNDDLGAARQPGRVGLTIESARTG